MTQTSVNILDYDSNVNNGLVDAGSVMQRAISEITSGTDISGYTLFCPPGIYSWQTPTLATGNFNLQGSGIGNTVFQSAPGFNNWMFIFCPRTIPFTPFVNPPIYQSRSAAGRMNVSAQQLYNATGRMNVSAPSTGITALVKDVTFDGNAQSQTSGGCIHADGVLNSNFSRVQFNRPYDVGLWLDAIPQLISAGQNIIDSCLFSNGNVSAGNGKGIKVSNGSQLNIISNCSFLMNGGSGAEPYDYHDLTGLNILSANIFNSGRTACWYNQAPQGRFIGNILQGYSRVCVRLQNSNEVAIIGNNFRTATMDASNTYSIIELTNSASKNTIANNLFRPTVSGVRYAVEEKAASGCNSNKIEGNNIDTTSGYTQGKIGLVGASSVARANLNYNPVGNITAPTLPASGVSYTNILNVDCAVSISGGTVTAVAIGSVATGLTSGNFRVPVGQTIAVTYSVAPTWVWFGD